MKPILPGRALRPWPLACLSALALLSAPGPARPMTEALPPVLRVLETYCIAHGMRLDEIRQAAEADGFVTVPLSREDAAGGLVAQAARIDGQIIVITTASHQGAATGLGMFNGVSSDDCTVVSPVARPAFRDEVAQWLGPDLTPDRAGDYSFTEDPDGRHSMTSASDKAAFAALKAGNLRMLLVRSNSEGHGVVYAAPRPPG